jgi:hypothetical protein
MTEREARDLASRVAKNSDVFDFDRALELVRRRPEGAERLVRMDEEMERRQKQRDRARRRMRQALIEDYF